MNEGDQLDGKSDSKKDLIDLGYVISQVAWELGGDGI
jgi:hypothetical protein